MDASTALPPPFSDPHLTAKGEERAAVRFRALDTLWLNTGTLCNLECRGCYIESSPRNDRLAYLKRDDAARMLDEIARDGHPVRLIGITGGEPFMNPQIDGILEDCLTAGHAVLILTNAMVPMRHHRDALCRLNAAHPGQLTLRVSLDHYDPARHEKERGPRSFAPAMEGLRWLSQHGFAITAAGRTFWDEDESSLRRGYARLFAAERIAIDAADPQALVLFPEMDAGADTPEITTACWQILGKDPGTLMCAHERMLVRRRGAETATLTACTLLPYQSEFDLGPTIASAARLVPLNHPHCSKFCVLGGGSCG
ncbi:radical SAM protein [Pacificimonas flava]|uniref:Radical SAM domain protein n=1 Tax=Pacificimonas flava TaxID=1234595 RepID=M2S8M0_9SPHN|nr:radical SAM protein [Pacificimonas flava]EMD81725.1 Radical SAM domain protein [Pacificimonas flava]MBB5279295.1 putative Fe-S cluster-containing radical SAM superfamily protein [Pacificimonas flava]